MQNNLIFKSFWFVSVQKYTIFMTVFDFILVLIIWLTILRLLLFYPLYHNLNKDNKVNYLTFSGLPCYKVNYLTFSSLPVIK